MKLVESRDYRVEVPADLVGEAAFALASHCANLPLRGANSLTISLLGAHHVDVAGVAVLVRIYSKTTAVGAQLRVIDASPNVYSELQRAGFTAVISITESQAQYSPYAFGKPTILSSVARATDDATGG